MAESVSIIGTGALGRALAMALHRRGFRLHGLFNRTLSSARRVGEQVEAAHIGRFPEKADQLGNFFFIAVSDGAISEVVNQLAANSWDLSGRVAAHSSGNEPSDILEPLAKQGAKVAAFHPLQTFNASSPPEVFENIYISLQGDDQATKRLKNVVEKLSAHPLPLTSKAKSHLHAAAVMASNYLVTLQKLSGEVAEMGGLDATTARNALHTLVTTTAENTNADELSSVLSGPIARGDVSTVKKHLALLEPNPRLKALYQLLGRETLKLADSSDSLSAEQYRSLQEILED